MGTDLHRSVEQCGWIQSPPTHSDHTHDRMSPETEHLALLIKFWENRKNLGKNLKAIQQRGLTGSKMLWQAVFLETAELPLMPQSKRSIQAQDWIPGLWNVPLCASHPVTTGKH